MRACAVLLSLLVAATPTFAGECASLDGLDWLLGQWEQVGETAITRETWTRVSAATFEGVGETLDAKDGSRRAWESLRLVAMRGQVFYLAKTKGNLRPVAFTLTECEEGVAVFDNPEHDFPRRLAYRLTEAGTLDVAVSDGGERGFALTLRRRDD